MTRAAYRQVHDFVTERAGGAYRAAVAYDADGVEVVYVREEFRTAELEEALPVLYERAVARDPVVTPDVYEALGEPVATTEIYERGVLVHFRDGPDSGFVLTLDREVARQLSGFVDQCNAVLERARDEDASAGQ